MESIIIYDNYQQPWRVEEGDALYEEAKFAIAAANGERVYWQLSKLTEGRGWGWWTVFKRIEDVEAFLLEQMPDPSQLVQRNVDYTPLQLNELLQIIGGSLSTLYKMEGEMEAQCHGLKQSYKTGMEVAITKLETHETTLAAREALVLSDNELFQQTRRLQIDQEAVQLMIQGWRKGYEKAWETVSRIITLRIGESGMVGNRIP